MRKRLLALLMVVALVNTLIPATAFAFESESGDNPNSFDIVEDDFISGIEDAVGIGSEDAVENMTEKSNMITGGTPTGVIYLHEGKEYSDSTYNNEITAENGLSFNSESNVWEMSGFSLTSTGQYGIYVAENAEIVITGENSISVSNASKYKTYGIFAAGSLTLAGEGSLSISSAANETKTHDSYGINTEKDFSNDTTVKVFSGDKNTARSYSCYGISVKANFNNSGKIQCETGSVNGDNKVAQGMVITGTVKNEGTIISTSGDVTGAKTKSYGFYSKSDIDNSGEITGNGGKAALLSCGISAGAQDKTITNSGKIIGTTNTVNGSGGKAYGIYFTGALNNNEGGTVDATAGNADYISYGVYVDGDILNSGKDGNLSTIIGKSGNVTQDKSTSYGIFCTGKLTNEKYGVIVDTKAGDAKSKSYGVRASGGITNAGSITATSGEVSGNGGYSVGVYGKPVINDGKIVGISGIVSGNTNGRTAGLLAAVGLTNNRGGVINAIGGESKGQNNFAYGILASNSHITNSGLLTGKTVESINGEKSKIYGIYGSSDSSGESAEKAGYLINNETGIVFATGGNAVNKTYGVHCETIINYGTITGISGDAIGAEGDDCGVFGRDLLENYGRIFGTAGKASGKTAESCGVYGGSKLINHDEGRIEGKGGEICTSDSCSTGVYAVGMITNDGEIEAVSGKASGEGSELCFGILSDTEDINLNGGSYTKAVGFVEGIHPGTDKTINVDSAQKILAGESLDELQRVKAVENQKCVVVKEKSSLILIMTEALVAGFSVLSGLNTLKIVLSTITSPIYKVFSIFNLFKLW